MAAAVAPCLSDRDLCLERDEITGPVLAVQTGLGGLAGALGGVADAHNALVGRLKQAKQQLDPLIEESGRILERLQAVEGRCGSLPQEVRELLCSELRAEFRGELEKQAKAQKADLNKAVAGLLREQENQKETLSGLSSLLEQRVAAVDERRQRAVSEAEKALTDRLRALEKSLEKLFEDVREQAATQQEHRVEQREVVNSTLPRLRSDLVARVEGLGAGLSERADHQATRLQRAEKQAADHDAELEKLRTALEMRALASKLAPMDARLVKAEEVSAAAARALTQEVARLEAQICGAKTALCDQMQALRGEAKEAGRAEASEVVDGFRANEGARLCELERKLQMLMSDHSTFADKVGREISGTREDIQAGRDWCARRIEALAETTRHLESAKQTEAARQHEPVKPAEPAESSFQIVEYQHSDFGRWEQDRDALAQQMAYLDHRQCSVDRRQETCDANVERLERVVRTLACGMERLDHRVPSADMAGCVTTKCISCGTLRALSPSPRSPSPPPQEGRLALAAAPQAPPSCPQPAGFRAPRSRPTSAGQRAAIEPTADSAAVPVGAAHSACRAIGPASPRRPRPSTATLR